MCILSRLKSNQKFCLFEVFEPWWNPDPDACHENVVSGSEKKYFGSESLQSAGGKPIPPKAKMFTSCFDGIVIFFQGNKGF